MNTCMEMKAPKVKCNPRISIMPDGRQMVEFRSFKASKKATRCMTHFDKANNTMRISVSPILKTKTPPGTTRNTIAAIAKITAAASGLILVVSFIIFAIWNH